MRDARKPLRVLLLPALALTLAFLPRAASCQVHGPHWTLSPYLGWAFWGDDVNQRNKPLFGARTGFMINSYVGIEGTYGFSPGETDSGPWPFVPTFPPAQSPSDPSKPVDDDISHFGLDVLVNLGTSSVTPFLVGGWQHVRFRNNDVNWGTTTFHGFEVGGGVRWYVSPRMALRLEARDVVFEFDNPPGEAPDGKNHNLFVTGGLTLAVGGSTTIADEDGDGVRDKKDKCPGTPLGALVDLNGCPIDGDGDGVFDGIDQCPNTPAGATVDPKGCPIDSDGDGVFDGIDQCAATPAGATVDAKGCPTDADGDTVFDGIDQCANTPLGATVDLKGCPIDSDGDSIFDGIDLCPNTPAQAKVDKDGCPIEISEKEIELLDTGKITVRNINFETGKWDILTKSRPVLDEVGRILIQWPQLRIEIGGHADARGTEKFNLELSQKRAQAVLDYLLAGFPQINSGQYTAVGYGESQPVASNKTVEGMAKNRRVEFKVLNTEALTKERERRRLLQKDE
jgi:outer membrane protein OmpA-like peptidoglycan-associated protein/opacity protein-like surface antigen